MNLEKNWETFKTFLLGGQEIREKTISLLVKLGELAGLLFGFCLYLILMYFAAK